MNYYERHIGDYLKDTAHLSLLEHGVYTRLLDVYYTREDGIPEADAARLIGARSRDEKAALKAVLGEYFVLKEGFHKQERCEREIARYQDKQAKAKRSAEARWEKLRPDSERNANASSEHDERRDATEMRTHTASISSENADGMPHTRASHSPDTRHQTPDPNPPASVCGNSDFEPPPKAEIHTLGKFPMRLDWKPKPDILEGVLFRAGKPPTVITQAAIANFVEFWAEEQAVNTETQWCQKLLASAQKFALQQPKIPDGQSKSAYEILREGLDFMDQDHDQTA